MSKEKVIVGDARKKLKELKEANARSIDAAQHKHKRMVSVVVSLPRARHGLCDWLVLAVLPIYTCCAIGLFGCGVL